MCDCPNGPRCEFYNGWCGRRANWSVMVPLSWKIPVRLGPKFTCNECWQRFTKAWKTPLKGIDRPEGADDDWKPSLLDMMHHARIAESFQTRDKKGRPVELTPEEKEHYIGALLRVRRRSRQPTGREK